MKPTDGDGTFLAPRRPVELPSEHAARSIRRALLAVALAVLLGGIVSGLLYHRFWKTVSHEVPWLLPASTQLYARVPRPWEALLRAAELPQWADPPGLTQRLVRGGLLKDIAPRAIGGIPTDALMSLARQAQEVQVALVPSPEGYGILLFARMSGADALRSASRALQAGMPVVDRQLGFAIHAATQPALRAPWGEPVLPVRFVEMPPFILLSLGPEAPLLDVLQAKVSGTSQPIRTREGFQPLPTLAAGAGVSAFLDPGPLFEALHTLLGPTQPPRSDENLRVAIAQRVLGLLLKSELRSEGEALRLVAHLRDTEGLRALNPVLGRAPRALLRRAPANADLAVAVGFASLAALPGALATLLGPQSPVAAAARRALAPTAPDGSPAGTSAGPWTRPAGLGLVIPEGASRDPGRWTVELALPPGSGAAEALARAAQRAAPHPLAHGIIYAALDVAPDQVVPEAAPATPGAAGAHTAPLHVLADADRPTQVRLAWRRDGAVLDAAASWEALRAFYAARRRHGTAGERHLVDRATRTLPTSSSVLGLVHPRLLQGVWGGAGEALASRLAGSMRLAAAVTLDPTEGSVAASVNVGPLSVGVATAVATRQELDRATLPRLPAACLEAFETLCARAPSSVPCEPWQPRRRTLVTNACRRALEPLRARRRGTPERGRPAPP